MRYPINTDINGLAHALLSSQTKKKDVIHEKGQQTGVIYIYETIQDTFVEQRLKRICEEQTNE